MEIFEVGIHISRLQYCCRLLTLLNEIQHPTSLRSAPKSDCSMTSQLFQTWILQHNNRKHISKRTLWHRKCFNVNIETFLYVKYHFQSSMCDALDNDVWCWVSLTAPRDDNSIAIEKYTRSTRLLYFHCIWSVYHACPPFIRLLTRDLSLFFFRLRCSIFVVCKIVAAASEWFHRSFVRFNFSDISLNLISNSAKISNFHCFSSVCLTVIYLSVDSCLN